MLVTSFIKRQDLDNRKNIIKNKILKFMHFLDRPILIGEAALEIKEGLELIEECMLELCNEHSPRIRQLSLKEMDNLQKSHSYWYVLTSKSSLSTARN